MWSKGDYYRKGRRRWREREMGRENETDNNNNFYDVAK